MLSGFLTTIQQDPVLSPGEAHRRALGRRRRRLPGRRVPAACGRSGTTSTATRSGTSGAVGTEGVRGLGYRLSGSSDLYADDGRRPFSSVNFVTAHDGFTLRDLVTYNDKHNEANGEDNRDGTDNNRSWNHGVEGETDDEGIQEARRRTLRNLLSTLLISTGVPMLTAGDEMGRTQGGNNNAYCQDNEISWVDWALEPVAGRPAGVHPPPARRSQRAPCTAPSALLRGQVGDRGRREGPGLVRCRRSRAHRRRVVGRRRPHPRHVRRRRLPEPPHAARQERRRRVVPAAAALRCRPRRVHASPGHPWAIGYRSLLDTVDERPEPSDVTVAPGTALTLAPRSFVLLEALR